MPKTWDEIKQYCISTGTLYEDPDFPPKDSSAFVTMRPKVPLEWKRPREIVRDPSLFVGGGSRLDICQGILGDCWFLAGLSALTQSEILLNRVITRNKQSFGKDYFGAFCFNFWQEGEWVEVIIDDYLPTHRGRLVFTYSIDRDEMWVALLEKAYAKLHGSFEALAGGHAIEAMEDFTGGVGESFNLKKSPDDLFDIIISAFQHNALMSCSIDAGPDDVESITPFGLVKGHAYTVTGANKVALLPEEGPTKEVELIRVRNPWGDERTWLGSWGCKSKEWSLVSHMEKRRINLVVEDNGEFWMSFQDFIKHFERLELCLLEPRSVESFGSSVGIAWIAVQDSGEWHCNVTAGGCRKYLDTFVSNPQFRLDIHRSGTSEELGCTGYVVVALMQTGRRKMSREGKGQMLAIGFAIYKVEESDLKNGRLDKDFFAQHRTTARSKSFTNQRTVTGRFRLPSGTYYVVPSTYYPDEEGRFLLRVLMEKSARESVNVNLKQSPSINPEKPAEESYILNVHDLQPMISVVLRKELRGYLLPSEVCRSIMAHKDKGNSGTMSLTDLNAFLKLIKKWKDIFNEFAKRDGIMDVKSLNKVFKIAGVDYVSDDILAVITAYYSKEDLLSISNFLLVMIRISSLRSLFCDKLKCSCSWDEFLRQTIGL